MKALYILILIMCTISGFYFWATVHLITVAWDEWQNEMVTVEDFIRNYNVTFKTYRKDKNKVKLFHTNKGNTVYIGFMHIDDGPYTLSHVNVTEIKQRKQNSNNK